MTSDKYLKGLALSNMVIVRELLQNEEDERRWLSDYVAETQKRSAIEAELRMMKKTLTSASDGVVENNRKS